MSFSPSNVFGKKIKCLSWGWLFILISFYFQSPGCNTSTNRPSNGSTRRIHHFQFGATFILTDQEGSHSVMSCVTSLPVGASSLPLPVLSLSQVMDSQKVRESHPSIDRPIINDSSWPSWGRETRKSRGGGGVSVPPLHILVPLSRSSLSGRVSSIIYEGFTDKTLSLVESASVWMDC